VTADAEQPSQGESLQTTAQRMVTAFNELKHEFAQNNVELHANTQELKDQKKYGRHTRFGVWVAILSLLIDLPITALLLVSYNDSQDAVHTANVAAQTAAHTAQEDLYSNCIKGNQTRVQEEALFNDILVGVSPTIGPSETTKFATLIKSTFAAHNCNDLKPTTKAPSDSTG
jgi:hypothetical protein